MIQIQRREQFTKAADRLNREPQSIRRQGPHLYEVTNKTKGTRYQVRITRMNGQTFGSCDCKAGLRHHAAPLVCKHLAAVVIYLRALKAMRVRASH
jgi:uncharacterized Zn finger protein